MSYYFFTYVIFLKVIQAGAKIDISMNSVIGNIPIIILVIRASSKPIFIFYGVRNRFLLDAPKLATQSIMMGG